MLRNRIEAYYGVGCEILTTRRTASGDGFWFVVDGAGRTGPRRTLGTIDRHGAILEQSAMDLLRPERLIFLYDRLMLIAFALAQRPRKVLLLGLGGGAMYRHLAAYLPDCALTIVERDPVVLDFARRFFHLRQPVIRGDAEEVVADAAGAYDVILVDLYDSRGLVPVQDRFWRDCVAALTPLGCLAINWAGFLDRQPVQDQIGRAAQDLGNCFFIVDRGKRPNMVQLAPARSDVRPDDLAGCLARFAKAHHLPAEDRNLLQRCRVQTRWPVRTGG
jgi:SAM-dependent methyltransferase